MISDDVNQSQQKEQSMTKEEPTAIISSNYGPPKRLQIPESNNTLAILQVIERCANDPGVDVEKMQKLLDMQERIMNKQQEIEYNTAFAQMQPELPPIPALGIGHNSAKFAKKEDMNLLINPILSKYGFALSFKNTQENGTIKTRATLRHMAGYSEYTEITLKDDVSGSKNAVQAVGSSQSYGERYTMKAILNLTILKDPTDDDAMSISDQRNKSKNTSSFQANVNADTKKAVKVTPTKVQKEEKEIVWDKKTIYMPGNKILTCEFKSSDDAGERLLKELERFETKKERQNIINLNLAIMRALIKKANGALITNIHKFADEGK